jgi:DNA-binding NarL/FixJ family response regulator
MPGLQERSKMPEKIKVLLVDDHQVVREGLRSLLKAQPDIEPIGEASNGSEAAALSEQLHPDVVVMDISMPKMNGLDGTRAIRNRARDAKILALSSYDDVECVEKMLEAGVMGFISKRTASDQLAAGIRSVYRGRQFFSPEICRLLQQQKLSSGRNSGLTVREEEVLQLIAQGYPNKGVAAQLGISIKTVEKHRQAVMNKLNIHEVAGLTRYAIAKGFVPREEKAKPPVTPETQVIEIPAGRSS